MKSNFYLELASRVEDEHVLLFRLPVDIAFLPRVAWPANWWSHANSKRAPSIRRDNILSRLAREGFNEITLACRTGPTKPSRRAQLAGAKAGGVSNRKYHNARLHRIVVAAHSFACGFLGGWPHQSKRMTARTHRITAMAHLVGVGCRTHCAVGNECVFFLLSVTKLIFTAPNAPFRATIPHFMAPTVPLLAQTCALQNPVQSLK